MHILVGLLAAMAQPGALVSLFGCIVDPHPARAARNDCGGVDALRGRARSLSVEREKKVVELGE